jgi:ABC-type glycerol-3-phosphate transport system permease component
MTKTAPGRVPGLADLVASFVPANVVDAAAHDAMLPVIVFVSLQRFFVRGLLAGGLKG